MALDPNDLQFRLLETREGPVIQVSRISDGKYLGQTDLQTLTRLVYGEIDVSALELDPEDAD